MFKSSWLRQLKWAFNSLGAPRMRRTPAKRRPDRHLSVEALQDRAMPSTLSYATFLGGSGDETAQAIAVDGNGNIYVAGGTISKNFPAIGAYDTSYNGGINGDAFVAKFTTTGSLAWATYLGGSGTDLAYGIAVDGAGNVYVTGYTDSNNFPTVSPFPSFPFQSANGGGRDAFVAKFTATGGLAWATYLGGNGDDRGFGIAVDSTGHAYVTGVTSSTDFLTNFLTVSPSPYQSANGGGPDAFVAKFPNGDDSPAWATYLGGSDNDNAYGIAVDSTGVYVAGGTGSSNFPTTSGAFDRSFNGGGDGFVAKLDPTLTGTAQLLYSTYVGGSNADHIYGLAVDGLGNAYVTGFTHSTNFPTVNAYQSSLSGNNLPDAFVTKLNLNATGSASLSYSTYLGGRSSDIGNGIAVDSSGNVYVTGRTATPADFPTRNAYDATLDGSADAFVAKLNPAASGSSSLLDSTYLGGKGADSGHGIAVDSTGAYVAGDTGSSNFPVTTNAYDKSLGGTGDGFVAKLGYGSSLTAASTSSQASRETLTITQVGPLVAEAIARWHAAGMDTSGLGNIQIQITNLGGRMLGMASGDTIWLDDNAAGWGWFVDPTPWEDSEFTTPGDQGEQHRIDLLTVLEHELGHVLGFKHSETGVMAESLAVGVRGTPGPSWSSLDAAIVEWATAKKK